MFEKASQALLQGIVAPLCCPLPGCATQCATPVKLVSHLVQVRGTNSYWEDRRLA